MSDNEIRLKNSVLNHRIVYFNCEVDSTIKV